MLPENPKIFTIYPLQKKFTDHSSRWLKLILLTAVCLFCSKNASFLKCVTDLGNQS
jgi:hypothetical protein